MGLFRFLGVELSNEIYTNASERRAINENVESKPLIGKE